MKVKFRTLLNLATKYPKRIGVETLSDFIVLVGIVAFLFYYFKPELLLLKTTISGGDTASHYYPAYFLKNYLLPEGKIIGWCPGWFAGIPLFQFYFPLLFLVAVLPSFLIPLEISVKIVTVLGTFLLPVFTYLAMRAMEFKFPLPALAAIFTLPFLFNEGNSMWGGNIPSTLAGEFSYSFSLSLTILFLGFLYRDIKKKDGIIKNSILFALIVFSHIITAIYAFFTSSFFLINKGINSTIQNFKYLLKIYSLAFMLLGFWIVPFILKLEYTTPFSFKWIYSDIRKEVFPDILLPYVILAFLGLAFAIKNVDKRVLFFLFSIIVSTIFYFLSPKMGLVDIRFIPFIQISMMIIAAYGFYHLMEKIKIKNNLIFPIIVLVVTMLWVEKNVTYIHFWIKWNYEGFEKKPLWEVFKSVNDFVKGSYKDPRVIFEHSQIHDQAGSSRAFESLPLFSGRSTYEGLYMQSSISTPFIFYFQSEISALAPCPYPDWSPCASFNSTKAAKHLAMFNVEYVIAVTDTVKNDLRNNPLYELVAVFEPYEIFRVKINPNRYVTVPKYEPVVFETKNWKRVSYEWFKNEDLLDVPLVFTDDKKSFKLSANSLENIPKIPINNNCYIEEDIEIEEIRFNTTCIGKPHIISISYYPNWKVEGADKIYLVSPSFMLVVPKQESVRLYYGETLVDKLGKVLTLLGIFLVFLIAFTKNQNIKRFIPRYKAS